MTYWLIKRITIISVLILSLVSCRVKEDHSLEVSSPDGEIKVVVEMQNDTLFYAVSQKLGQAIEPSPMGLELSMPFEGGFKIVSKSKDRYDEWWKPVYGEYSEIHDYYNSLEIALEEKGNLHRRLNIIFRAYNEGVAFRYLIPEQGDSTIWQITKELSAFNFPEGSSAFPIYRTEQTYSNVPVAIEQVGSGALLPFTVRLPNGFASLLDVCVNNYPNILLEPTPHGNLVTSIRGTADITFPYATPWRAILLAKNEGKLIENERMVLNLNPPCAIKDPSWIKAGKTISNESSGIGLDGEKLKKLVDFASENGFKYLQLDWGWYGTEVKWTDKQVEDFSRLMPAKFRNTKWKQNTTANPYTVAKGYVPYGWSDRWKNAYTLVDLDIHELIAYAKTKGVGISLYVEAGQTLRANNLDSLFSEYEAWGLAGLKPGFVKYGTQENTTWIQNMVETAARHHLLLCIHDARIPDGTTRTYPNLIINEGGGGQEGNHPVVQDVMLPFARCLAGPFDYTPFIYTRGKSNAHMLSFFVAYYGPAQTVRGAYVAWNGNGRFGKGGEELEFIKKVPASWDDTKVLSAKIGDHLIVARKYGNSWFLGGMTGDQAFSGKLALDFLDLGKTYEMTAFCDDPNGFSEGWCPANKTVKKVNSANHLSVEMLSSGGFVGIFDPVD